MSCGVSPRDRGPSSIKGTESREERHDTGEMKTKVTRALSEVLYHCGFPAAFGFSDLRAWPTIDHPTPRVCDNALNRTRYIAITVYNLLAWSIRVRAITNEKGTASLPQTIYVCLN